MSFLGNLFGGGNTGGAPAGEGATGTQPTAQPAQEPGATGSDQGTGQEGAGQVTGLDSFSELWQQPKAPEGGEGGGNEGGQPGSDALFNLDPQAIQQAVSQIDFAQSVTPEILSRVSEGGEDAQRALLEMLNATSRQVFSTAIAASARMVETAYERANGQLDTRIQSRFRESKIADTVESSNPVFKHPAAKPMVDSLRQQLAQKYPTASEQEVANMANQYFTEFAKSLQQPQGDTPNNRGRTSGASGEVDWEAFFNS